MDSNSFFFSIRILVLESGVVKEYDKPAVLLADQDSLYYKMVKESEKTESM